MGIFKKKKNELTVETKADKEKKAEVKDKKDSKDKKVSNDKKDSKDKKSSKDKKDNKDKKSGRQYREYDAISDRRKAESRQTIRRTMAAVLFAFLFLMPTVLTFTNSFMTASEINANYGAIFAHNTSGGKVFVSETVNLKFIPDMVTFSQYATVLFKSPEYLMKFWNSVIYVVPIVVFQLLVASLASFGFARYRGKVKQLFFFLYIVLMLMPYQVTLVPNFMVSSELGIIGTRWAIWLPGIFSPFAVYMLTKYMRRIPYSLYEAAAIDGAGEWQIFTQICMPICRGGLASIAILIFIDYWNMVEQPLILLDNEEYMVLPMLFFLYGEEYLVEGILYQGGIKE